MADRQYSEGGSWEAFESATDWTPNKPWLNMSDGWGPFEYDMRHEKKPRWEPKHIPTMGEITRIGDLRELRYRHHYFANWYNKLHKDEPGFEENMKFLAKEVIPGFVMMRMKLDPWFRITRLFIQVKGGGMQRFVPNRPQKMILVAIGEQLAAGVPVRVKCLKGRQWGASTMFTAIIYDLMMMNPDLHASLISHTDKSAGWINKMFQRFYRLDKRNEKKDAKTTKTGTEWKGEYSGDVIVQSARFAESGLSETRQIVLCDEGAFYPDFDNFMGAASQVLPELPDTFGFVNSTPFGYNSGFHKFWKREDDGYARIFVPWHIVEEYATAFLNDAEKEDFETSLNEKIDQYGDEKEEQQRYGLTLEQLNWRRKTLIRKCQARLDTFKMFYPGNEDEGFQGGSRRYFGFSLAPMWEYAKATETKTYWEPEFVYDEKGLKSDCILKPSPRGRLVIYRSAVVGKTYIMGVDSAGGRLVDAKADEPDRSVIQVIGVNNMKVFEPLEQCAEFCGHMEPDLFGWFCVAVGKKFNNAWAAVENNNHGRTVVDQMKPLYYHRLMQDPRTNRKMDITHRPPPPVYGFTTTGGVNGVSSRERILDELYAVMREENLKVFSEGFLEECDTFLKDDNGRPEAQAGCHDDRVMAMAFAVCAYTKGWISGGVLKREAEKNDGKEDKMLQRLKKLNRGQSYLGYTATG